MKKEGSSQRRKFIKKLAYTGFGVAALPGVAAAQNLAMGFRSKAQKGEGLKVLFQGDSITDGNRSRDHDWNHIMGHGYAYLIASRLWYDFPEQGLEFINRGVRGDKVTDLAARWKVDTLALKPDVLSVLVGINDVSKAIEGDNSYSVENYEKDYNTLLEQTRQQLPDVEIVLCSPFILPVGRVKENFGAYQTEVQQRQAVVKKLADTHNAIHLELQKTFNKALFMAPADYWIWDGIHPMPAGHELIAREWIQQVSERIRFIEE